ncbi:folliculin-interacting protein 2 isoform X2 [Parasteatoda tepidariorum]|uniref:folliculin-interacting protein 2 isoform X2 n=1 Tax=Parasteatoda tepidariorum TaxID=114398 RepID=UPI000A2C0A36
MAPFLSRLFSIQKKFSNNIRSEDQRSESKRVKPPDFDSTKQVRVLLFREHNGQERRLLFDSKAVRKRDPTASPNGKPPLNIQARQRQESSIEKSFRLNEDHSKEYVYESKKPSSDETLLREMIFGSVSISYHGTLLKVHAIRSPSQVMLSLVFPAPSLPPYRTPEPETEESGTWTTSVEVNINKSTDKSDTHLAHSVPVNVPSRLSCQHVESRDSDSDSLQSHDGHSSLPTTHLSPETPVSCLPRSSSYNSLQRRILRNKATSIELGLPKSEEISPNECSRTTVNKRVKLGLSVVINLSDESKPDDKQLNNFIFTHISLIEGHLMSLKDTVIRAYLNRKSFLNLMFEGSKRFQKSLCDLYAAPRLVNPEWLTIISSPNHRHLSYTFLAKFADLLKSYDKKETNFFVSTLLTAVLTHHLAWVPSVIPTDSKIQPVQSSHKHIPCWVDLIAKSRPYNPLWMQLSDLYGGLGIPPKLTKTIVKGQKKEVILRFLRILSYFIRCSDICQQEYDKSDDLTEDRETLGAKCLEELERSPINVVKRTNESNSNTPVDLHSFQSHTCKKCLPQNSCIPHSTAAFYDPLVECASNSSKDTCELTITPTEERTSEHSLDCSSIRPEATLLVPTNSETFHTNSKRSEFDSLGYMSLEEKVESLATCSKRLALQEQHPNCCQDSVGSTLGAVLSSIREGKENNPLVNVTCVDGAVKNCLTKASADLCQSSTKARSCCCCKDCPCYGNQNECEQTQCFILGDSSKVRECESIEEGYHSMEEPHSPSREPAHLSEMLRRLDNWRPEGCQEKPMPGLKHLGEIVDSSPYKSFGWSLMAGVSDHYLADFCLQGLNGQLKEEEVKEDLRRFSHVDIFGEPVSESVCIIADTDKWKVNLLSSNAAMGGGKLEYNESTVIMSSLVSEICDAILNMCELKIPAESCIIYLEDRLQELYTRSQTLADFIRNSKVLLPQSKVASALNVDISDMPLLLSIATTHSPNLSVYSR